MFTEKKKYVNICTFNKGIFNKSCLNQDTAHKNALLKIYL